MPLGIVLTINTTHQSPITAFVLTFNAELSIEPCLNSLSWADEVMIIDSGSVDRTVDIASRLGIRVVHHAWEGYGNQLNFALSQARYAWVFFTDQDEIVSPELAESIRSEIHDTPYKALRIQRQNKLFGDWLHFGGAIEANTRCINKTTLQYCPSQHTRLCCRLKKKTLDGVVYHDMAPTLIEWWSRSFKLATIEAKADYQKGVRFSAFKTGTFWWKFVRRYVLKLGFLDGWAGLYMALQRSIYILVYQACLLELDRKITHQPYHQDEKFR